MTLCKLTLILFLTFISSCFNTEVTEIYKWTHVNYTWPNQITYQYYVQTGQYIPENNLPCSIKINGNRIYMALGKFYPGTPVTIGYSYIKDKKTAPLITPFPDWKTNTESSCSGLQNVIAFEFGKNGLLWIVDGLRFKNLTDCPPKLVIYNVSTHAIVQSYNFPREDDSNEAYLGDMALDNNYAYITDSNILDPGIIVYSKITNKSWKLRDSSMFPDQANSLFTFGAKKYNYYYPVGPIVVSPKNKKTRFLFYSPVSSLNIYKINVHTVHNQSLIQKSIWRTNIQIAGTKVSQSFSYAMKNNGDLYFTLLTENSLAKWNIDKDFRTATYVTTNNLINWCTSSSIQNDDLYLLTGNFGDYFIREIKPTLRNNRFSIIKINIKDNKNRH